MFLGGTFVHHRDPHPLMWFFVGGSVEFNRYFVDKTTTAPMNFLNAKLEGSAQIMFLFKLVFTSFLCRDCPQCICGMIIQKNPWKKPNISKQHVNIIDIFLGFACLMLGKTYSCKLCFFMMIYILWDPNQKKNTFNLKVRKLEHTMLWIIFSIARLWMTASKTISTREKSWEQNHHFI